MPSLVAEGDVVAGVRVSTDKWELVELKPADRPWTSCLRANKFILKDGSSAQPYKPTLILAI